MSTDCSIGILVNLFTFTRFSLPVSRQPNTVTTKGYLLLDPWFKTDYGDLDKLEDEVEAQVIKLIPTHEQEEPHDNYKSSPKLDIESATKLHYSGGQHSQAIFQSWQC